MLDMKFNPEGPPPSRIQYDTWVLLGLAFGEAARDAGMLNPSRHLVVSGSLKKDSPREADWSTPIHLAFRLDDKGDGVPFKARLWLNSANDQAHASINHSRLNIEGQDFRGDVQEVVQQLAAAVLKELERVSTTV